MFQRTTDISSGVGHIVVPSKTGGSISKAPSYSTSSSRRSTGKRRVETTTRAGLPDVKRQRREREPSPSPSKAVTFSSLEIWGLSVRPGHHPRCRGGAALELGDDVSSVRVVPLEDYEARRLPRRTRGQMRLPRSAREALLVRCGYSIDEINRHGGKIGNKRSSVGRKKAKKAAVGGLSSI